MTYDSREILKAFHSAQKLNYPLLQDDRSRHVDAYGIRNQDYGPGDRGFGVPHPGIIYITAAGTVALKFAIPGYRHRPPLAEVYQAIIDEHSQATQ